MIPQFTIEKLNFLPSSPFPYVSLPNLVPFSSPYNFLPHSFLPPPPPLSSFFLPPFIRIVNIFTVTKKWVYPFLNKMPPPVISLFFAACFFVTLGIYLVGKIIAYRWWGGECGQ